MKISHFKLTRTFMSHILLQCQKVTFVFTSNFFVLMSRREDVDIFVFTHSSEQSTVGLFVLLASCTWVLLHYNGPHVICFASESFLKLCQITHVIVTDDGEKAPPISVPLFNFDHIWPLNVNLFYQHEKRVWITIYLRELICSSMNSSVLSPKHHFTACSSINPATVQILAWKGFCWFMGKSLNCLLFVL